MAIIINIVWYLDRRVNTMTNETAEQRTKRKGEKLKKSHN